MFVLKILYGVNRSNSHIGTVGSKVLIWCGIKTSWACCALYFTFSFTNSIDCKNQRFAESRLVELNVDFNDEVKKGDTVVVQEQMWMNDFASKTLNRTFDELLFVGRIDKK